MAAPAEPARLKPVGSVRPSAPAAISASCQEDGLGDKDAPTPVTSYFRPFAVTTIVPMLVNRTAAWDAGSVMHAERARAVHGHDGRYCLGSVDHALAPVEQGLHRGRGTCGCYFH